MEERSFDEILQESGFLYKIERNGEIIKEVLGKPYKADIRLSLNTSVERGDILIDKYGERHKVKDSHITYLKGTPRRTTVVIEQPSTPTKQVLYNFNGSIMNTSIGENATTNVYYEYDVEGLKAEVEKLGGDDKPELQEIITLLEAIRNNTTPVKSGMLSKFSKVIQRNSWITAPIVSTLLAWIMGSL